MKLVKIEASDYGLEENKAKQIKSMFEPMLNKMIELEDEFNEVVKLDISDNTIVQAKELRLKYVKVRTGTSLIHKELKSFYLKGGRFVDGWKNAQLMASEGIEKQLQAIENYYINIEKEKMKKLQEERAAELAEFNVEEIPANLDKMPMSVWISFKLGIESSYLKIKDEEIRIEKERIEAEKAEKEKAKQLAIENEKLKKEAEERERLQKIENEKKEKAEEIRLKKEAAEKVERERQEEIKAENQRKIDATREAETEKKKQEFEFKLKKERDEKEKAEKIIRDREEKERLEEIKRLEEKEKELNKGDEDKIKDLIKDLNGFKIKYSFASERNKKALKDICIKIDEAISIIK